MMCPTNYRSRSHLPSEVRWSHECLAMHCGSCAARIDSRRRREACSQYSTAGPGIPPGKVEEVPVDVAVAELMTLFDEFVFATPTDGSRAIAMLLTPALLVDADQFGDLEQQVLCLLIDEYRGESWSNQARSFLADDNVRVGRSLSIRSRPLESQRDLHNVVGYLCKPVDIATPYLAGIEQCQRGERSFCDLNQAKDDFLMGVETLFGPVRSTRKADRLHGRTRFGARGTLDGRSPRKFIGVKRSIREKASHQRLTKIVLTEARLTDQFAAGHTGTFHEPADPARRCSDSSSDVTSSTMTSRSV